MSGVVNIAVKFPHKGKVYEGFTLHGGVSLELRPAGCGVPKTQLIFVDGDENPVCFLEGVTGADFESGKIVKGYLQILPKNKD